MDEQTMFISFYNLILTLSLSLSLHLRELPRDRLIYSVVATCQAHVRMVAKGILRTGSSGIGFLEDSIRLSF